MTMNAVEAACAHAAEVLPLIPEWERSGQFPRESIRKAAAIGLGGLYVPKELGGAGLTPAEVAPVYEELGRTGALYGLGISVHNFGALAAASAPAGSRAASFVPQLVSGELIGGFLLTESSGGSDPMRGLSTTAVRDGDGYRVSGTKTWVTMAGEADLLPTVVRVAGTEGTSGTMMVLIEASAPGVRVTRTYDKSTGRFFPVGEIELDDVRVDPDMIIAGEGDGIAAALSTIDIARVHIAAASTGLARRALEIALADSAGRELFGTRLLDHQSNLFSMADVETGIHTARLLYQHAAGLIGQPGGTLAAAHAKRFCPDMAVDAAIACTRLMGANGSLEDSGLPALLAGAQMLTMADGATGVQRLVIGRELQRRVVG